MVFDAILVSVGFTLFLVAVVGQFKFFGFFGLETYQSDRERVAPIWDRIIAGEIGIVPLSIAIFHSTAEVLGPTSTIIAKAASGAVVGAMILYLFALILHDWNDDPRKNERMRKAIRLVLIVSLGPPLIFLVLILLKGDVISSSY